MNPFKLLAPNVKSWLAGLLVLSVAGLSACGQNDDEKPTSASASDSGDIVIGLTDAQGDFINYNVGVKSLTLTKLNGTVVETTPLSSQVDFAELTDMTEFLTVATIPSGIYTKATVVLDYSGAIVNVEAADGLPTPVEKIVDGNGDTIATLEVSVRLEGRNALTIVPGVPAHLQLDFDLKASNSVDFASSPLTMTVEPFLLADLQLEAPKTHRARGLLRSVNTEQSSFQMFLRPFMHVLRDRDAAKRFGLLNVHASSDTVFEIDGVNYQGADGIAALDLLDNLASVVAVGDLQRTSTGGITRQFMAREVYAGSSVAGGDQDVVSATVMARNGDVFTVKGATLIRSGGSVQFNDEVQVTMDAGTKVYKQALIDPNADIGDISVGQRVRVFGKLTNTTPGNLQLDATGASKGRARLLMTVLAGLVNETGAGELVMDVKAIDGRVLAAGLFDFSNTGSDPANYRVATGELDISGLGAGQPVRVRGFVAPFGQTPPDFAAVTVLNEGNKPAEVAILWEQGDTAPFANIAADGMVLSYPITAERVRHLAQGITPPRDLNNLMEQDGLAVSLAANAGANGVYAVKEGTALTVHTTFTALVDDLNSRLDGVKTARALHAKGGFDWTTGKMDSHFIAVVIGQPRP